jgi:hypothetical protein
VIDRRRKYRDLSARHEPAPQPFETPIPLPAVKCSPQSMAELAGAQALLAAVVQGLTERVEALEKQVAA